MCFPWLLFKKEIHIKKFDMFFECSCDLCDKNFDTMEKLIKHMGSHALCDIQHRLDTNLGTVRCNKCWKSFRSVLYMAEHPCTTMIKGLSPISSSGSLDSILIHNTYIQEDNHRNS